MPRLWVLVEWVDESNVLPSYGVVKVDPMMYNANELNPGRVIVVRIRHDTMARRGRILTLAENKHYVKSHKKLLERQDGQVKNVLTMCMQTIKGIQSDSAFLGGGLGGMMSPAHGLVNPRVSTSQAPVMLVTGDSDSSLSDSEMIPQHNMNNYYNTTLMPPLMSHRLDAMRNGHGSGMSIQHIEIPRPMMSSTPLPVPKDDRPKLTFDQATQTDNNHIKLFEKKLRELYGYFITLTAQMGFPQPLISNTLDNTTITSESDGNEIVQTIGKISIDQIIRELSLPTEVEDMSHSNDSTEDRSMNMTYTTAEDNNLSGEGTVVRRRPAQTTNDGEQDDLNSDMVPIGHGHAVVPARLLNDIDWNSYTTATRQLLQAIFPRRTLATHSLTGKKSPAFQDKPPKKCLDPKLVEDIVITVSQRCGVEKRLVRNSITVKCTDEAKLYRNRQQFKLARSAAHDADDEENPVTSKSTTTTSEESLASTNS